MHARDDDQKTRFQAVEDLEGRFPHETAANVPVDCFARFWEVKQRDKHRVDCVYKLCTRPEAFGFIPFERGGDVVFRLIEKPDRTSRLSRQGAP